MSSKRLAIYLVCAFVIYCAVRLAGSIKAARERERFRNNEQQVKTYIASIRPRWETFRQTNAGLECIKIESTYHEDGSVAVYGPVTSQVQIVQVVNFFRDTHPPRPLWTDALRVDLDAYRDFLPEPAGAANRSQPVRSETNRTSSAAGPGR